MSKFYLPEDDLNGDGIIDPIEHHIKVMKLRTVIKSELDHKIQSEYINVQKQRKEVDFHHKVIYRFEKAYRLSKKHPEKREQLN